MFSLGSSHRYYLFSGHCDMRKSFDGLCGLISGHLGRSATGGDVFVFLNRRRTHMKLLHWEHGGFVLYYKRLEGGTFPVPKTSTPGGEMDWSELVADGGGDRGGKESQTASVFIEKSDLK